MSLAWFTPFSTQSAIGEFSRHVTAALAQHADVDIWTADRGPLRDSDLRVICFGGKDHLDVRLGGYDILVYNMGNYPPFHRDIHEVSKRHPGIVILHDRVLHHLFALDTWRRQGGSMDPTYVARMRAYYGEDGARVARRSVSGHLPVWEHDHEVVKYPLDEEALQGALGAVTHTHEHARYLQGRWLGPVRALQHPAYGDVLAKGASAAAEPVRRRDDGRIQLTTIGHVNANKHSDSVIRMLAADAELARMVHYTIVGPIDEGNPYAAQLRELMRSVRHVSAEMLGWCEEDELDRLMAAIDVFINLRHPVMESGSGTLMRELRSDGRSYASTAVASANSRPGPARASRPATSGLPHHF